MTPYTTVGEALDGLPPLDPGESSDVPNHAAPRASDSVLERIASTDGGECLYDSYETNRRLALDEPAPTIIGKDWKYAHPEQVRAITVRERARLQTFDDDYRFVGPRHDQRQQVANAVPPTLAERLGKVV